MIKWIKTSFLDKDNRVCGKRLTGLLFVILTTLVVLTGIHTIYTCQDLPTNYLYFLGIMVIVVLMLFMVISVENVIELIKVIKNKGE